MNQHLSFSIVTPSFNQGAFIGEALLSVKNQNYGGVEQLVIDGGSHDGTITTLRHYSDEEGWSHLHWISEPDRGQSDALNKGFAKAKGDIVGWLNSDDRYRPSCFERVAEVFQRHPEVDVVYGDYTFIDETGRVSQIRREIAFNPFILLHHRVLYIPTTATFFRRRVFEEGNRLDERLHYALDFEFFMRLAIGGYKFRHVSALLADFRMHEASKTCTAPDRQLEEKQQVTQRYSRLLRKMRPPVVRQAALVLLRSLAAILRYSEKLMRGYYFDQLRSATTKL
jgi:glycosyltransferase involved in cell wall biosynthesis